MNHKKQQCFQKKQAMTLLEIMIVILIIGIIGSVVGYNMRGSLKEGKAFKTKEGISKVYDILQMEIAKGATAEEVAVNPLFYLRNSGIARKPSELLKDGWGKPYEIEAITYDDISIRSKSYDEHLAAKSSGKEATELVAGSHYCRVCGYYDTTPPWGPNGNTPSYQPCDCCGAKAGENDISVTAATIYRERWIQEGCNWNDSRKEPKRWSINSQLNNVPAPYN